MQKLNLPPYDVNLRKMGGKIHIFDPIRKKFLVLTPEEWVRQNFLLYMMYVLGFPQGLLAVEYGLELNGLKRRCDILSFDKTGNPRLIVECKAATVKITQKTFTQIATYNLKLQVDFLIVTNGLNHYCCLMDYINNTYQFLEELPDFEQINSFG
jgi:hypothetical protein